ncbi:hypothetical protein B6Q59_20415 [Escherichia coli]|nr:hypothetical protein [Escherichia coli]EFO2866677.1 hypothetical protein [Escherichia coli]
MVINSGLSPRSLDEPASLEWCGMREILPILDRFERNDQKCLFLRFILDYFDLVVQESDRLLKDFKNCFNLA